MSEEKILVIAPHCDDEILGCGGVIAKYISLGVPVYVAIVTNGHKGDPELFPKEGTDRVRAEAKDAHTYLGVRETIFLDFPAVRLEAEPSYKLSNSIREIMSDKEITTFYIPHRGDIHKDHRATYEASLVAARPVNNCPVKKVYAYETLSETEWAAPFGDDAFVPTVFEDITEHIDHKLEAFKRFKTQIKQFPHSRSPEGIENLAKVRGATIGVERAEAFMLVREIR